MSYETADLLDEAADIIERDGWCQGAVERDGAHCALGALNTAVTGDAYGSVWETNAGLNAFTAFRNQVNGLVSIWNNEPERTKQEVLDTLRLAAKNERAAEDQP